MKEQLNLSFFNVLIAIIALTWFTACEDGVSVQDIPPAVSQDLSRAVNSEADKPEIQPIEGQYIVVFHEQWQEVRTSQVAEEVRVFTDRFLREVEIPADSVVARFEFALRGFTARMDESKAEMLMDDPRVDYVEQNRRFRAARFSASEDTTFTTTSSQTTPWGISRVAGPLDGTGKRAWVLDTGVDLNHLDLNISSQHNVSFIAGENADDLNGHGTHVAGILAARDNNIDVVGVAAGATVVSVKVLDQNREGPTDAVVNGIEHVVANASTNDIINMSLGAVDPDELITAVDQAVENAADMGFRFVIAAGNDEIHANNATPARVVHNNVWTISATNSNNQFASFSNFGNPPIRFAAPGVNVLSLNNGGGTTTDSGTSMSAPHVAGILLVCGESGLTSSVTASNDPSPPADPIARANSPLIPSSFGGSVVQSPNNPGYKSPKLDWSSVSGVIRYEIQRRHWQGSWKVWATSTTNTYTDTITMSQDLQVFPWGVYNDYWVAYRVRVVTDCGTSPWTQAVYFRYHPGDSVPLDLAFSE